MHPVTGELLAGEGFGLGDLVLVVREDQVVAAAVDVDLLAQDGQVHGRAFDVPAGASLTPGTVPGRFPGLGSFPDGEVHRVLFFFFDLDARPGLHVVDLTAGEFAVFRVPGDAEVDIPVLSQIGKALVNQALDHGLDPVHGLGGARVGCGGQDVQVRQVLAVGLDIGFGQYLRVHALLVGAVDYLVIHIREVHHVAHLVAAVFQVAPDYVEDDGRHGVPNVCIGIDRRAADVHLDHVWLEGLEFFFLVGEGIVDAQHGVSPGGGSASIINQGRGD
jgi:hypothetical protein